MHDDELESGASVALEVAEQRPKLQKPPMYRVILLNDDFTPMEFVVSILTGLFGLDEYQATRVMLEVHHRGKGICGIFTRDVAETKVAQVNEYSRQHQYPLLCTLEVE